MYCSKCGGKLNEQGICPYCGNNMSNQNNITQNQNNNGVNPSDTGSVGWWFLGFFFPLVGLILYFVFKSGNQPKNAHKALWGALVSVIIKVVFIIFTMVFYVAIWPKVINTINDNTCKTYCTDATYNEKDNSCVCGDGTIIYIDNDGNEIDSNGNTM